MSIVHTCPHCGAVSHVSSEFAGLSGPCAVCGGTIKVPDADNGLFATEPPSQALEIHRRRMPGFVILGLVLLGAIGIPLLLVVVFGLSIKPDTRHCRQGMEELGLALKSYCADYGTYPPPYLADANGKPMHSWRVLLLPYVGGQDVFDRYRFDEPWDGPNNRELIAEMPSAYGCPASPEAGRNKTSYVAVVGPGMAFDASRAATPKDFQDDPASTVMLVEVANSDITWSEPVDLDAAGMSYRLNEFEKPSLSSYHRTGVNVLMADGSAVTLRPKDDERLLKAMLTINGKEPVKLDQSVIAE